MPQTIASVIGVVGGPFGVLPAAAANAVGIPLSGGLLGNLLGIGPKAKRPGTTEAPLKTSRPERVSAYGVSRLYGAYALFETASNGTAVDVFAVHDGRMDGAIQYYLNDDPVTLAGDTVTEGSDHRYKDSAVHLYSTDGSTPGTPFSALVTLLPGIWTSAHRGDGVVMLAQTAKSVKAKDFQETYPQSAVPTPSMAARWQLCPDPAAGDPTDESGWTWTENPVRHLLHYKLVREGVDFATRIAPAIDYWIAAAADCDVAEPLAGIETATTALASSGATHIALASVTGLAAGMTIVIAPNAGISIRETKTVSSIVGTTVHFSGGLAHDHASGTDVSWASDPATSPTEPRYRSCFAHKHTDAHKDTVDGLLATFDGWIAPRTDGAFIIYSGRYYEPTVPIGPDQIVSYSWDGLTPGDDSAVNEIPVSYVSADHKYNMVEGDAWRDEADISSRGKLLSQPLEAQIPSHSQGRRIAKRLMARAMAPNRGTVTTNVAGRVVRGERFINLTIEEAGTVFYSGPAEITAMTRNLQTGGVTFSWVEADPAVDDWTPSTDQGSGAPIGDRVDSVPLDPPAIVSAIFFGTDSPAPGAPGARIRMTITGPDRDDLTWFARWRTVGAATWGGDLEFSDVASGPSVVIETDFVPTDTDVEVQASYRVGDGRVSDWSAAAPVATGPITFDDTGETFDSISITMDRN